MPRFAIEILVVALVYCFSVICRLFICVCFMSIVYVLPMRHWGVINDYTRCDDCCALIGCCNNYRHHESRRSQCFCNYKILSWCSTIPSIPHHDNITGCNLQRLLRRRRQREFGVKSEWVSNIHVCSRSSARTTSVNASAVHAHC